MKKLFLFLIGVITLALLITTQSEVLSEVYQKALLRLQSLNNLPFIDTIRREVNLPGPLRGQQDQPNAYLTKDGVIAWTNTMRQQDSLSPLTENELLNQSAQQKLNDMFERQYFEHVSPIGTEPSDVVTSVGYAYLTTGENLALGNFADDQTLVQGWMDSPGHRANILHSNYQEIGVAVGQGMYEGKMTWMAVQHFGRPLSACPQPDDSLKSQIDQSVATAEALKGEIDTRKHELETSNPDSREERQEYNRKVEEYNEKVREYNRLVAEIDNMAATYNSQINSFNTCARGKLSYSL